MVLQLLLAAKSCEELVVSSLCSATGAVRKASVARLGVSVS